MKTNKSQQEMVGFVLIVVLVMIGLMVFLIISLGDEDDMGKSSKIDALLDVYLEYTTDCAIVYEPEYDDVRDLIKSCHENKKCSNLDKMACEYLNETTADILNSVTATDADIEGYQLDVYYKFENNTNLDSKDRMLKIFEGDCNQTTSYGSDRDMSIRGSQRIIATRDGGSLIIRLRVCSLF